MKFEEAKNFLSEICPQDDFDIVKISGILRHHISEYERAIDKRAKEVKKEERKTEHQQSNDEESSSKSEIEPIEDLLAKDL